MGFSCFFLLRIYSKSKKGAVVGFQLFFPGSTLKEKTHMGGAHNKAVLQAHTKGLDRPPGGGGTKQDP